MVCVLQTEREGQFYAGLVANVSIIGAKSAVAKLRRLGHGAFGEIQ